MSAPGSPPDSDGANLGPRRTDPEREPHICVRTDYAPPSGGEAPSPWDSRASRPPGRSELHGALQLNRIAYYLRRNDMDAADVLDALVQTKNTLDTVRRAIGPLASSVRSIAESRILFL